MPQVRTCIARIIGTSPYQPSQYLMTTKDKGETHNEYEQRTWRDKAHVNKDGLVFVPPMAFKKALDAAVALTPEKIAGRGNQTYGKQFKSGVLVETPLVLETQKADLTPETYMCSATGDARGVGTRVPRTFPTVYEWGGDVKFSIINPTIQKDVFEKYLVEAGLLIGVGRFRPENGGTYGRFRVESTAWTDIA